jgi:hypothetical protein
LTKTFWGWRYQQLPYGTIIFTSPAGHTYVTAPGSALLFPGLCQSTGGLPSIETEPWRDHCGERTAMMPKHRRTHRHAPTCRKTLRSHGLLHLPIQRLF